MSAPVANFVNAIVITATTRNVATAYIVRSSRTERYAGGLTPGVTLEGSRRDGNKVTIVAPSRLVADTTATVAS
jgi:hypothetical protein